LEPLKSPEADESKKKKAPSLRSTLFRECEAMTRYAMGGGLKVPPPIVAALERVGTLTEPRVETEDLMRAHSTLSELIAPATPRSVMLMVEDKVRHPYLSTFGPVPLVRMFMYIEVAAVLSMLLISLFEDVNTANMQLGLFKSSGWTLLKCEGFLICVSLVGSAFSVLFKLQRFISEGTFDPKYSSVYWLQLVLGMISGVVLSQVIYGSHAGSDGKPSLLLQQPVLALAGGFSAPLVHRILNRLIVAAESMFGGNGDDFSPARVRKAAPRHAGPVEQEATAEAAESVRAMAAVVGGGPEPVRKQG